MSNASCSLYIRTKNESEIFSTNVAKNSKKCYSFSLVAWYQVSNKLCYIKQRWYAFWEKAFFFLSKTFQDSLKNYASFWESFFDSLSQKAWVILYDRSFWMKSLLKVEECEQTGKQRKFDSSVISNVVQIM